MTKLERGDRRVTTADLLALAAALGVNPNRLLFPVDDPKQDFYVTSEIVTSQAVAWSWANGYEPLWQTVDPDSSAAAALDDFTRHTLPEDVRLRDEHSAMKAARDVQWRISAVLERSATGDSASAGWRRVVEREGSTEKLRRALDRLKAEVNDLAGDDNGDR